jgi:hypothetical protein
MATNLETLQRLKDSLDRDNMLNRYAVRFAGGKRSFLEAKLMLESVLAEYDVQRARAELEAFLANKS